MKLKYLISISLILAAFSLQAAPKKKKAVKSDIKVAVYNLRSSKSRADIFSKGQCGPERLWSYCADGVAEQIIATDCDILGLIDVCDSIAGRVGNAGLPQALEKKGAGYSWLALSNTRPSLPIEGAYNRTQAIIWKTDKYECLDYSINWLGGLFDKNRIDKALKLKGDATKSVTWAKFREKSTGKEFYFMVAATNGASSKELNLVNCKNLVKIADEIVVTDDRPSIIVGSFNMKDNSPGYVEYIKPSRWIDVYSRLKEDGMLLEADEKTKDTRNNFSGEKLAGGRWDYILVDGFRPEFYMVGRNRYPSPLGKEIYPAFGFPVISYLKF